MKVKVAIEKDKEAIMLNELYNMAVDKFRENREVKASLTPPSMYELAHTIVNGIYKIDIEHSFNSK